MIFSFGANIERWELDLAPFANVTLFNRGIYAQYAKKNWMLIIAQSNKSMGIGYGVQSFLAELRCLTWLVRYEQVTPL